MENQLSAKYAFDGADKSGTSIFASYSNLIKVNMQQRFSLHRCLKKEKREEEKIFQVSGIALGKMLKIGEEGIFNLNPSKPELGQKNKTWPKTQRTGRYSLSPK